MPTIKEHLQNLAASVGVRVPDSFVGNTEGTARTLLQQASAAGRYLRQRDWRALTFEHTFSTADGTLEYALPTDPAFHHYKNGTAFDRTNYRRLTGPLDAASWQYGEALLTVGGGIEQRFRIKSDTSTPRVNKFFLLDDPDGTYTLAYEYVTHEWLYDGSSGYKESITADTDVPVFDEQLFELEVLWRVLRRLGEPYFDEKDEAMRTASVMYAQENGRTISMQGRRSDFAVNVPEGNFPE